MSEAGHMTDAICAFSFYMCCVYRRSYSYVDFKFIIIKQRSPQSTINYAFNAAQKFVVNSSHLEALGLAVPPPKITPRKFCAVCCYISRVKGIFSLTQFSMNLIKYFFHWINKQTYHVKKVPWKCWESFNALTHELLYKRKGDSQDYEKKGWDYGMFNEQSSVCVRISRHMAWCLKVKKWTEASIGACFC